MIPRRPDVTEDVSIGDDEFDVLEAQQLAHDAAVELGDLERLDQEEADLLDQADRA